MTCYPFALQFRREAVSCGTDGVKFLWLRCSLGCFIATDLVFETGAELVCEGIVS